MSGDTPYVETGPVTTPAFGINVNFAASSFTTVLPGYVEDFGSVYGLQNGLNYGWDDNNAVHARQRNSANSPDERYDTFNHMMKTDPLPAARQWEIEIPNEFYSVHIVGGDPDNTNSVFQYLVEGQPDPGVYPNHDGPLV